MKVIQKAVIKNEERYLVLKRSPNAEAFPNYWDFPGGKLEKNENPEAGIEREIFEETGLSSKATGVVGLYEIDILNVGEPTHQFVLYNTETAISPVKLSSEHTDYKWCTRSELLKLPIEPYMKLFFESNSSGGH